MITHGITVSNRTIAYGQAVDNIVAGGSNADELSVTFDDEWEGLACRCVFVNGDNGATTNFSVENGAAVITVPFDAIAEPGHLFLTFVGKQDDVIIKTRMMSNSIPVVKSGQSTTIDREPTRDEIERMIALVDKAIAQAEKAIELTQGQEDERNATFQDLTKAFADAQAANDAAQAKNNKEQLKNNAKQTANNNDQALNNDRQAINNTDQAANNQSQNQNDIRVTEAIADMKSIEFDHDVVAVDVARAYITEMFKEGE